MRNRRVFGSLCERVIGREGGAGEYGYGRQVVRAEGGADNELDLAVGSPGVSVGTSELDGRCHTGTAPIFFPERPDPFCLSSRRWQCPSEQSYLHLMTG